MLTNVHSVQENERGLKPSEAGDYMPDCYVRLQYRGCYVALPEESTRSGFKAGIAQAEARNRTTGRRASTRQQERDRPVPRFVDREPHAFLDCGILARGFLRLHCQDCRRIGC